MKCKRKGCGRSVLKLDFEGQEYIVDAEEKTGLSIIKDPYGAPLGTVLVFVHEHHDANCPGLARNRLDRCGMCQKPLEGDGITIEVPSELVVCPQCAPATDRGECMLASEIALEEGKCQLCGEDMVADDSAIVVHGAPEGLEGPRAPYSPSYAACTPCALSLAAKGYYSDPTAGSDDVQTSDGEGGTLRQSITGS